MSAPAVAAWIPKDESNQAWADLTERAPQLMATMRRYLVQCSTFLAPRSVDAVDVALRQLSGWLVTETDVRDMGALERRHVEDYKVWLAAQTGVAGAPLAKATRRQRLGMIRTFIDRLIEWDWPDAPGRNPVLLGDAPARTESLPKFLSDADAAKLLARARAHPIARYRLVVELLARTGMRASELCELPADAVRRIGEHHWLHIPLGKLRNDRLIPLHPDLVTLLAEWTATNGEHIRAQKRLLADEHRPIDRRTVHRIVASVAKQAGIGHVHPHQLRHTLATQAINRGMRIEAIAALLGHRTLEMTLIYARIANRVVADEYEAVSAKIDASYQVAGSFLPADLETPNMAKLRKETHARMLGNGLCTRPVELDCKMESICETCAYFETGPEFVPVLLRQRDHAKDQGQTERARLFETLVSQASGADT
ncbi:MAG TPA: site-specific integrase [Acidimicrobiales bacterium]|nr:site-specific integrase [Acidimicrobiales bacterium]